MAHRNTVSLSDTENGSVDVSGTSLEGTESVGDSCKFQGGKREISLDSGSHHLKVENVPHPESSWK